MRRSLLTIVLLLTPLCLPWALGNPEEGEYEPVAGLENWDYRLDVEGRKAGKYNLIVRGTDQAGNVRYEGPYNLYIDPESDLPVVHISYPTPGARAGSLLHVVGTCVDDDGVQRVEVQLDDREWMAVRGTDYWSLALDLKAIPDGEHVLTARCVDVNDLAGAQHQVRFQLDKQAPVIQIGSHENGSLVTGNVELEGTIQDANGIASLAYSLDGGGTYEPLKTALDKPGTGGSFKLRIDTRERADGPFVVWLKGADRTGSASLFAFLLFVNNEAPELAILAPEEGQGVNGAIRVIGTARDQVGLESLRYQVAGGEEGTIELTAGNPYWTHEIDLSALKAGTAQVVYTLRNLAGNEGVAKLRLKVDPESDEPRLTLAFPEEGSRISGPVFLSGFVRDDDGVDRVEYTLDGGEPVAVSASTAFAEVLEQVTPGAHKLKIKAVDVHGVSGAPAEVSFTRAGGPPTLSAATLLQASGPSAFAPGMSYPGDKDARISGTVRSPGAKLQVEYSLRGEAARPLTLKKGAGDERTYELPLSKSIPPGRVDFTIRVTDEFGNTGAFSSFLFKGTEPEGSGIALVDSRIREDGVLRLDDTPLTGFVFGGPVQEARLEPPTALLRLETEGAAFRVYPSAPGVTEPTRITVTAADGSSYQSEAIRFVTDFAAPETMIESPSRGQWLSETLQVQGRARDPSGVAAVEYSFDGTTYTALSREGDGEEFTFTAELPIQTLEEGPHLLWLRVADKAGNQSLRQLPFFKDATAPVVALVAPRPEDEVNGSVTVVGRVEDAGAVALVELSEDGTTFRPVGSTGDFAFEINLSKLPEGAGKLSIRSSDKAGNQSLVQPQITVSLEADRPVAQIQLPANGELIRSDFVLSGMVFDDDGVAAVYYRIDDGEFRPLPGGHNFSVPLTLQEVGDNEHTIEVKAEDLGGLESETAVSRFRVSTSDPVSSLEAPAIDSHLREVIELEGTSQDPNGIAEVRISLDNGVSYVRANGTEAWTYRLDTRLLADGTHAVLVEAEDSTGAVGLFTTTINVDNQAPDLVLDSPTDGQVLTGKLPLSGRAVDAVGVSRLAVSVTPTAASAEEGAGIPEAALPLNEIMAEQLDIDSLAPGWYNLRIEASDEAGNRSYVSRNFLKRTSETAERVELFFPADGERVVGPFGISGRVYSENPLPGTKVVVTLDGRPLDTASLNATGHFHLKAGPEQVPAGSHALQVQLVLGGDLRLTSETHRFEYAHSGPWVDITSFATGDFVSGRPFLQGEAGYAGEQPPAPEEETAARKASRGARGTPKVQLVEISMDNGRSFVKADGKQSWRYRLETQALPNGPLRLLVKASFSDGQTAVTRTQLIVDTRPPEVTLLEPGEGGRFNDTISLIGTAGDDSGLEEIAVSLREGDKSRYQVPAFVQGLYLDLHFMGATYWDAGLGLTFFDDNVKLQLQVGMSPPGRFSGLVIGTKLLANIATLPFGYLFGPSWDFFSMSLAVGANFAYFTMSEDQIAFTDAGLVLGSIVAQVEFARFAIPKWRAFNDYSLYAEYQLWFISSDIEGGTVSKIAFGLRAGLF